MRRFCGLVVACALAWAVACSSDEGDVAGGTHNPSEDGGGGGVSEGGANTESESGVDGASVDGASAAYTGGDVTVSLGDGDGGVFSGKVMIQLIAATPSAIAKIEALVDGNAVGTATEAPFGVAWDSASVGNGAHTVSARSHDRAGGTMTTAGLAITTSNFLLAGKWKWSNVTDSSPGFSTDPCLDATFTVTFDEPTSTMTLPAFTTKCTPQTGLMYTSSIDGFSQVVAVADYGGPITNKTGTVTTTFSSTMLRQTDSFNGNTQNGKLTKVP
jgi:hypothetical protein